MTASLNLRGPARPPMAAVTRGTPSVQTSRFTRYPFSLESRLTSIDSNRSDDAMDEDAEHEHGHDHVERDAQLHDERHARRDADRDEEHGVLDRQQRQDLRNRLLARHHQEQPDQQHRQRHADEVMAHTRRRLPEIPC